MKTLRELKQMYRVFRLVIDCWPRAHENEPVWREQDAEFLYSFLMSNTGRRFIEILRHREGRAATEACTQVGSDNLMRACYYASGYRGCIATLITMSAKSEPLFTQFDEGNIGDEP